MPLRQHRSGAGDVLVPEDRSRLLRSYPTVTAPDKPSLLAMVDAASAALDVAREALHQAVHNALDGGATWSEVGEVLGVSRQAAFQRFGPKQAASPDEGDNKMRRRPPKGESSPRVKPLGNG